MDNKKKISIVMSRDMFARFVKAHKQMVVTNKSEALRVLIDEALKSRGV